MSPAAAIKTPCHACGKAAYLYFNAKHWCTKCGIGPLAEFSKEIEKNKPQRTDVTDEYELNRLF